MSSTFTGTIAAKLSVDETMNATDVPNLDSADMTARYSLGVSQAISGVTKIASMSVALSGGAATIDLTALTHRGVAVDLSALKVKYVEFYNPSTHAITITEGAANGNSLLGSAFKLTLQPGDYYAALLTASQTVAGADKTIDVTGTGTDTLSVIFAAG